MGSAGGLDSIFVAWGPPIRPGVALAGARVIDLAPTVLHLLGGAVPPELGGRILMEMFDAAASGPDAYTAEDETLIVERLRSLGYME